MQFLCGFGWIFSFPPPRQWYGTISADSIEARFENGRRNWTKEDSQNRCGKLFVSFVFFVVKKSLFISVPLCDLCGKNICVNLCQSVVYVISTQVR
jgi:hypothetical protein